MWTVYWQPSCDRVKTIHYIQRIYIADASHCEPSTSSAIESLNDLLYIGNMTPTSGTESTTITSLSGAVSEYVPPFDDSHHLIMQTDFNDLVRDLKL